MMMGWIGTLGFGAMFTMLLLYFLPTVIVLARRHQDGLAIFMLNLLLGWTALGWIVALIWSLTEVRNSNNQGDSV